MPLFTTEHPFGSGIASKSKSCQVGSDIWVFEYAYDNYFEIIKIDIDAQIHWKWSFSQRSINKEFHIYSSNGKIYLWIASFVGSQIKEFDPVALEWITLANIPNLLPSKFIVLGDNMYIKKDKTMMVMCMDTFQITRTINLPIGRTDKTILHEMNGLVYLVRREIIGLISFYQYHADSGVFQQVMRKAEQGKLKFRERFHEEDTFTWSKNDKIYVAIVSPDRILIDCFDVVTKQCDTVMDSYYGSDEVMDMFEREDIVYVVSRRYLDIIIQKIEMNPSLETIALVNMAEMVVNDPRACHKECQKLVPHELRKRFNRTFVRKAILLSVGKMEVLGQEMKRLTTNRDNEVQKFMELQQQMDMEREQLFQSMDIGIIKIQKLTQVMGIVMDKFLELQREFIKVLNEQQQQREKCHIKYPNKRRIARFEGLSHDFLEIVEQPRTEISYTLAMVLMLNNITSIAEIEEQTKQQKEKFIMEQEKLSESFRKYRIKDVEMEKFGQV